MIIYDNFEIEQINCTLMMKDLSLQFKVNLELHYKYFPNIYLIYKDTKIEAIVSKEVITLLGVETSLTRDNYNKLYTLQKHL